MVPIFSSSKDSEAINSDDLASLVASLLGEVIRADYAIEDVDLTEARKFLTNFFKISDEKAARMLQEGLSIRNRPTSYHPIMKKINKFLNYKEKLQLVEGFWRVACADSRIDSYEDHIIRKFANLMFISHPDFIAKRNFVRDAIEGI